MKKAPKIGKRYVSSIDKSPTRKKSAGKKNGSTKIIRVHIQCICGEGWTALVGKRFKSKTVCPRCHQLKFTVDANKKTETFSVDIDLHPGFGK